MMLVKSRTALDKARDAWRKTMMIRSSFRYAKMWVADTLTCACTFPEQRMEEGPWGYHCPNDQCRDYVSRADAKTCGRLKLDTASVLQHMRSSSMMRALKKAEKTGEFLRAHNRD